MADSLDKALRARAGLPPSGTGNFAVTLGDRRLQVSFGTDNDDEVTRMFVWCSYDSAARPMATYRGDVPVRAPRPLSITLTPETAGEVEAKQRGLVVEWQSHDPAFDDRVFVSTPITDASVLAAVIGPAARRGALALLDLGFDCIEIDVEGVVRAGMPASGFKTPLPDDRAERALAAFAEMISELPSIQTTGATSTRPPLAALTALLSFIGIAGWLLNVGYVGLVTMAVAAIRPGVSEVGTAATLGCVVVGLLGGVIGSMGYGAVVERMVRGRSDALTALGRARLAGFGAFSVLTFTAAFVAALLG